MNYVSVYYSTGLKLNCFLYLESKNRACGFEGGDCCRNELPPEERPSIDPKIDCGPGLSCQMNYPSPYATGTCLPRRNYGSKIFLSLNHISDF